LGGGDTSQRLMIQAQPDMADHAEQERLAIVAAYLFSPRLDDLAFLKTYERMGFRRFRTRAGPRHPRCEGGRRRGSEATSETDGYQETGHLDQRIQ
jgi:hypothetical protein